MVDYIVKQFKDFFIEPEKSINMEEINTNETDMNKDMFYTFNVSDNEIDDDEYNINYKEKKIDNNKLKKIVEGYETDIELENYVFKEEEEEEDNILYSIQNYIKNTTNKFMELLESDTDEKCEIDNIINTLDDLYI